VQIALETVNTFKIHVVSTENRSRLFSPVKQKLSIRRLWKSLCAQDRTYRTNQSDGKFLFVLNISECEQGRKQNEITRWPGA